MRTERTTLIYWVAAALAMGGSTAMVADNWVKLTPLASNSGSLCLDKDSIKHNADGTVHATTRGAYGAPRKLSGGEAHQYDMCTSVYDCKGERILSINTLIQDSQHGTVFTKTIDGPRWEAIAPRPKGETTLHAMCQR